MKTAIKQLQAVVFDLDGTLCDSAADLAAAVNAMCTALQRPPLSQAVIQSYIGDGMATLVHRCLSGHRDGRADLAQWEKGFNLFALHYTTHLANHTRVYPETEAGLQLLKSLGFPLAVVTNKNQILACKLLQSLGLADYFSIILGGDSLPEKKPSPAPLLHVAEVLGVAPQTMMMVGDSANDILAAKAAGCLSVGVTFGYGNMAALSQQTATRPDWIIESLPQIYEHLHRQNETGDSDIPPVAQQ